MYYLALVFEAPEGGYDFTCPDIPGFTAHSDSRDFSEAAAVARGVLNSHLAVLVDNGGSLPTPRDPLTLANDAEYRDDFAEAVTSVMLPALLPAGRTIRVNLSLDERTVVMIDSAARDRGLTRSAFVAEAARRYIEKGPDEAADAWPDIVQAKVAEDRQSVRYRPAGKAGRKLDL